MKDKKPETSKAQLEQEIKKLKLENANLRHSIRYQIGYHIINAKTLRGLIRLPLALIRVYKQYKVKATQHHRKKQSTTLAPVKGTHRVGSIEALSSRDENKEALRISKLQSLFLKDQKSSANNIRVAGIMDEFTFHSYAPECELLALEPNNLVRQLKSFKPDFVFIESAWKGKDDLWKTKVSNLSDEVIELIKWCRKNNVPSVFWNKEDPVHFATFLPLAKLVDFVFTTDIDCIAKYKQEIGHGRAYLLPFAAQPKNHNPIDIYERKDKFCFAGSYYLRYPERQRDFASIINACSQFKPVDIYDRNHDNPHPHYIFPKQYEDLILGTLPFSEIDKAYKGYNFGINMNTIKQSQTMFARRVYELLASNTVVVSNYSRGIKSTFGDLVVCSDSEQEIKKQLAEICTSDQQYKKYRLRGLRKVMQEHTYGHRLSFIKSVLSGKTFTTQSPNVLVMASVKNVKELTNVIENFERQSYFNKSLVVLSEEEIDAEFANHVTICSSETEFNNELTKQATQNDFISVMSSKDYYGKNFFIDLLLAINYSDCQAYGKKSFYLADDNVVELVDNGKQYKSVSSLMLRQSVLKMSEDSLNFVKSNLNVIEDLIIDSCDMLAVDEFNYCRNGMEYCDSYLIDEVSDAPLATEGGDYAGNVALLSEKLESGEPEFKDSDSVVSILAKDFFELYEQPKTSKVNISFDNNKYVLTSKFAPDEYAYFYANKVFKRSELNLELNSLVKFVAHSNLSDVRTVFEFQNASGEKIAHAMPRGVGEQHSLAIPEECCFIRVGLRIQGKGRLVITRATFGAQIELPTAIIGQSETLVLTKQYPSYGDLYKYGFLHSRIRAYREQGKQVDVFRITNEPSLNYREFEGVDIAQGNAELLDRTLSTGQYRHVLVHLLDKNMWQVLHKHIDNVKVTVWAHGAEIQLWQRRIFEFEQMNSKEVERQKKLSDQRKLFWQGVLAKPHENLHMVFVSKYFRDEVFEDFGITLVPEQYSIIPNIIDDSVFPYVEKQPEKRLKVLSIRPYASRKYANDLTVKAILALRDKSFFNELEFTLVGDGILFEEITKPLLELKNVKLVRGFKSQKEIAELHKEHGVFLTPTRMDSQGVSRDEAMSSGLVPITTNVAAIPEFVDDSCGYIAPPEDYEAMAKAIEELYASPEVFCSLSVAASNRIQKTLSFEYTINKELKLI